uniref:NADH-ubiquinone oxidoreductase chain 6 n=1 Tax=Prays oleae TaxID=627135 RepID=A0A0U1XR97_9NEOP|nr:NADH dehydrogenase subunit 6 [Prays oleae]AIY61500.1 NADH dehydrogenase subunit 6 [Prays oleae]
MKMFIFLMMMMTTIFMYFLNHPLSMGLFILIQTFLICIISGMIMNTYWFSYILFLTFLGGMLVLFIYVSSIASNELLKINNNFISIMIMLMIIFFLISMIFKNNLNWMNFFFNEEMKSMKYEFLFFNNENKINLSKLYNNQIYMVMFMMIIYLFIALIAVVKITNIFHGPIRSNM